MQVSERCLEGRSYKVFLLMEKKKGQSKFMHALKTAAKVFLTAKDDIRWRAADFFADLYSSEESFNIFCGDLPKVSVELTKELGDLSVDLLEVFEESFADGFPPQSCWRAAVLTLLH
ncbi:hypothetical protein CRENBAI_002414 [Crenichthys baileyi]|uniref:Uncharacterized protein n=1 Tax=Crenichthys baileyi TaxID=28760 RepID=A0AAV9RH39_9TELE